VIAQATDGALDITIGPLVHLWKIGSDDDRPPPDSTTIDSILSFTGFDLVEIENGRLLKKDPRIQLDFNAIAQGYTVDLICRFLEGKSIADYLVEVGGEVKVKGVNSRNRHWQIGIDKPLDHQEDQRELQTSISLHNQSMATSGSYRKYKEKDGKKYSHVIDPKTGFPANHSLLSVSVIAEDCSTADGYATAFLVMGLEKTMPYAIKHSIPVYCIYGDENGNFAVRATPDFPKE
jgi:thiamine biosynthesis lipoprotein